MYCKNCGQSVGKNSKFCKNCGQEVKINKFLTAKANFIHWVKSHKKQLIIAGTIFVVILAIVYFDKSSPDSSKSSSSNPALSVVNILCTAKNSGESSGGSGTIINKDGLILTNAHIIPQIKEAPNVLDDECLVVLPDEYTGQPKEIYYAQPEITKGFSKEYDIATLQIISVYTDEDGKSWGSFPNTFPEFQDGPNCEDEYIKLGDSVRIYGYPVTSGGYNLTVTDGVVSSLNDDGTFLTSAKIDSGNSGGLAIDQNDCFMGIPSAIVEGNYQNLGVIIPPDLINDFINEVPAQTDRSTLSCNNSECYFKGQCISKPANSSCAPDGSNDAWICNDSYVESGNYCIKPTPTPMPIEKSATQLCQDKYGWNTYSDGTYCQCNDGYTWNKAVNTCITKSAKCAEDYPNTYWDGTYSAGSKYQCSCNYGYTWNSTTSTCVSKSSVDQICRDKYGYDSYYLGYMQDGKYMCK